MKKYQKIIIVFLAVLGFIIALKYITNKPMKEKISDYLLKNGYSEVEDLYQKKLSILTMDEYNDYISKEIPSTYTIQYFSIADFRLTRNIEDYRNFVTSSLTETYDFKESSLVFTYRIMNDEVNAIFKGYYQEDKTFVCEKEFSYGVFVDSYKETVCSSLKEKLIDFKREALLLFPNAEFIHYMKNQKEE